MKKQLTRLQIGYEVFVSAVMELDRCRSRRNKRRPKLTVLIRFPYRKTHQIIINTNDDLSLAKAELLRLLEGVTTEKTPTPPPKSKRRKQP